MSRVKIGVLVSGDGTNLQAIIDEINVGTIHGKIELVISNKEEAYALERSKKAGIEAMFINPRAYVNDEEYNLKLLEEFKKKDVELILLAGFLKILSKEFVAAYRNKIMNIHPSLMPSFCGKNYYGEKVHEGVLNYGAKYTGATVHFVDEGTDTGPIILQEIVKIDDEDTVSSLQNKVLQVEHKILVDAVKRYCDHRIVVDGRKVKIKVGGKSHEKSTN